MLRLYSFIEIIDNGFYFRNKLPTFISFITIKWLILELQLTDAQKVIYIIGSTDKQQKWLKISYK